MAAEDDSEVEAGEADSDTGGETSTGDEEVSTGGGEDPEDDPPTELAPETVLSHPPHTVSPGTQTVVTVGKTTVLVAKLVLKVPVVVDNTGLIVQEIQSDGKPDGTLICLFFIPFPWTGENRS